MTKFLIHKFIPQDEKQSTKDRQRYGVLSGIVGNLCNLLLSVLKFICGTVSHSVSITADAANNLSDASSNIVTVIGAKIASKPVDNDHPFGHGRMEYISALIVDFFIFLMGFELGKSSIEKIIHPQEVRFSAVTVAVLVLSIGIKLWMAYFNQALYKESNNLNLKAVRQDSLNDCISTAAAGAALLLSAFTAFDRADGIMGLLVAAFILAGGVSTLKDIVGPLLGQAPSKELVDEIYQSVMDTGRLDQAREETKVFPEYLIRMTQIGEETGTLDEVMESLAEHYDREEAIRRSVRSAISYPLLMIGMMLVIIIILMTKVMPVFDQVFRQFGQEMTGFSRGILLAGNALSRYSAVFAVLLAVIVCAGIYFTKTESGRKKLYHIGSGFAFSRELKDKLSACRFAGGMSLALKSGLTPEQGMEFSENLIEDDDFRKKVAECKADMENGTDIAEALVKAGIFTGVYARMTSIAGKAGMMDEMMGRIADECEEEVDEKLSSMIAVLEPTLVIILSVIVGTILLSVMLPLLEIMSGL